uniref:Carboxylic ester hydrolase n=1 Tax=Caenorhabditis brenneri TaxID=135651 RepID=B6VBI9_CAEBE|nr:hypothetical protein Cbre_JD11.006 [Caenorhabditis brenneri]
MGGFLSDLKPEINSEILYSSCGPIHGNVYKHEDKIVEGYLGIPFAEPPERFQKPIEANIWNDVKQCTTYGPGCPQSGIFDQMRDQLGLVFDEHKCLSLNVFVPQWKRDEVPPGFPVIVNIFGGGFEMGTSAAYDDFSISGTLPLKDVIVVTINYRVGAYGFFTTGDDVCHGNFALWDQTLALKWIQKHIASFGGNPKNVTVVGCSAGGVCADLLTLSTHSRDLFQKCISMSGSADCEMACRSSENQAKIFREFAMENGCYKNAVPDPVYTRIGDNIDFSASKLFGPDVVDDSEDVLKTLNDSYLQGIEQSNTVSVRKRFIEFLGDAVFNDGILKSVQSAAKSGNDVYFYSFDFCNPDGYGPLGEMLDFKASSHGNDFRYIFGVGGYEKFVPNDQELEVMEMMITMFSNFAKYGNPNGVESNGIWEKYTLSSPGTYFKIDHPTSEMKNGFLNDRLAKIKAIERKIINF